MTTGVLPIDTLKANMLDYVTYYYETGKTQPDAFGVTAGNFDAAGCSHGILQYNFYSGTLQPIWSYLIDTYPTVCKTAFNNVLTDYNTWVDVVKNRTTPDQIAWGESISNPDTGKHSVLEPWNTYFKQLGVTPESQARQMIGTQPYFDNALTYKNTFQLWSRRGYTLCFDICVQSGSISTTVQNLILGDFNTLDPNLARDEMEHQKMIIIANRRADAVSQQFQASYRDRKLAIANGSGTVYGGAVTTVPYDLILEPAFDSDVYIAPPPVLETSPYYIVLSSNILYI